MYYAKIDNPLCPMTLVGDPNGLQRLYMHTGKEKYPLVIEDNWNENCDFFTEVTQQLRAYAEGHLKEFTIKLNPQGTAYQKKAWNALTQIPYGQSRTYKEQAIMTGNPNASRAVGNANGKNPIPVIIPCHRVIASSGKLTGFAFGLDIKKALLDLERSE